MDFGIKQSSPSYYETLGVAVNSSAEQIRRAYRKLAMVSHRSFLVMEKLN